MTLLFALALAAAAPEPTLEITNARLADGSGGAIVARVIDAKGLVLAPGFSDMHSHADSGLLAHPDAASQGLQGITTALGGQDGGCQCVRR